MPARTGTASQVDGSAGNGSTSVTVPADASGGVAFWAQWDEDAPPAQLVTLTLGGNAFTINSQAAVSGSEVGAGVASLFSLPGTGTQTLAWTWDSGGSRQEGGWIVVVWVNGHNTSTPVRDSDQDANTSNGNVTVTIDSQTTDLILAAAMSYGTPALSGGGTVFINNGGAVGGQTYDIGEVPASATSTAIDMTGEDFSTIAAVSLPAAAVTSIPIRSQHLDYDYSR